MVKDLPVLNIESELPEKNDEDTSEIEKMIQSGKETMNAGKFDQAIVDLYKIDFAL